ncbi:uncharacterized protein N7515_005773 [Penicillium bovifimosum]|uniref:Uncharacterized protein n=1 Tax=Penicillium bovifimosum TaxID=126998 RepID=A0A9W9GTD3_9EURO|nr:uncharacterized protein N7515_005773 [Penicillium bovifimosum]KAJ5129734.1 hypothetical protein N7515_005773 [Penicillium bovifimosum]
MPDIIIVNDNASFSSSDTFSTRDSIEQPRPQLRRKSTVVQLTRKVSKRISQSILRTGYQEHELSERNLRDLNNATHTAPITHTPERERQLHGVNLRGAIHEHIEEECPPVDVEAVREMRLHESYAAFCHNFTLSGNTRMSRRFHLSMGLERADENVQPDPTHQIRENEINDSEFPGSHTNPEPTVHSRPRPTAVVFPISDTSIDRNNTSTSQSIATEKRAQTWPNPIPPKAEEDFTSIRSSFEINRNNYPHPPPQVITPTVWMDQQREEQNRKAARRQRMLNPFRSWFLASQPSWGRRYEVVE